MLFRSERHLDHETAFSKALKESFKKELESFYKTEEKSTKETHMLKMILESDLVDKIEVKDEALRFRIGFSDYSERLVVEFYPDSFINGEKEDMLIVITYFQNGYLKEK